MACRALRHRMNAATCLTVPASTLPASTLPASSGDLAAAMAGAARGDGQAIANLHRLILGRLRRMIQADLAQIGVFPTSDALHDLVGDGFLSVIDCAAQWRPDGGAHPCHWARRRILSGARRSLGLFTDDLDAHEANLVAPTPSLGDPGDVLVTAAGLAARHDGVRLLLAALDTTSQRDRGVFLRVAEEQGMGNRHASVTVAAEFDLQPAAVRQICRRARVRLAQLVNDDSVYEPLAQLSILAA